MLLETRDREIENLLVLPTKIQKKETVQPREPANGLWERIHIDFAGPMNGWWYLIVVDAYSK